MCQFKGLTPSQSDLKTLVLTEIHSIDRSATDMADMDWHLPPAGVSRLNDNRQSKGSYSGAIESASANFKRKAARVIKTNSAGSSPHSLSRRRTTAAHGVSRHKSTLDEHYDNILNAVWNGNKIAEQRTRPTSWHPSSRAARGRPSPSITNKSRGKVSIQNQNPSAAPFTTATVNGLVTPLAYLYPDESFPHDSLTPLDDHSGCFIHDPQIPYSDALAIEHPYMWPSSLIGPEASTQPVLGQTIGGLSSTDIGSQMYPEHQLMPRYVPGSSLATTAPPTPDFLPIQNFSSDLVDLPPVSISQKPKPEKDELVGMGLYDAPETLSFHDNSLEDFMYLTRIEGALVPPQVPSGKGLKLEETFRPSVYDDEEEDEEDEEEEIEQEEDEESEYQNMAEVDLHIPPNQTTAGGGQAQMPALTANLSNHTFFFESEDDPSRRSGASNLMNFPGDIWSNVNTAPYGWI